MALEKLDRQSHDSDDDSCFKAFVKEIELKDETKRRKSENNSL